MLYGLLCVGIGLYDLRSANFSFASKDMVYGAVVSLSCLYFAWQGDRDFDNPFILVSSVFGLAVSIVIWLWLSFHVRA